MEPLILTDKNVFPSDEIISSILGERRKQWDELMLGVRHKYPEAEGEWRYYMDGKSWLFKMTRKKKTLFWIGIIKDTFRITFYFGGKAAPLIQNGNLPAELSDQYFHGPTYGKIRAITIKVEHASQVEQALQLVDLKVKAS